MEVFIFLIVTYILLSVSLYFLFPKAGEEGWRGLVPFLNFIVWCRLVGRPTWHVVWLVVPIVNIFVFVAMCVEMARSFGKYKLSHSALAVIYAPAIFFSIAFDKEAKYLGPSRTMEKEYHQKMEEAKTNKEDRKLQKLERQNPYKKSVGREWIEAIVFAVFAAAFIRMFLIEAYTIPTSSMEGSLLVGDFLFVSKAHYGIRTPKTIAMVPLLHNRVPFLNRESYFENPDIPFTRLPALENIDRYEPVVFNYPEGDSVYVTPSRTYSVYDLRRNPILQSQRIDKRYPLVTRPLDKRDHYIKRCIGIPGDSVQIINRDVYINGEKMTPPEMVQFSYKVTFPSGSINTSKFEDWGISKEDQFDIKPNYMVLVLNQEQIGKLKAMDPAIEVTPFDLPANTRSPHNLFPYDPVHYPDWTIDNFGPIYVPKKGATVKLDERSIAFYDRIIRVYEGNTLERRGNQFILNGEPADTYTFKMNYYWMMGDNRHNSEDSRFWGYVPEDHVVGKPLFIWFSTKEGRLANGVNWNRIFTSASKR
ncbi:MAG: signal peptidase I [Phaeodactylibacter sp.]|nr:signal peptidase I [Phaeodactylibacter sp.]